MARVGEYIRSHLPADKYPGETNDEVVLHFRRGECTFDQVLLRYHYMIAGRAMRYIEGMDPEDIYQELMIKLHKCCDLWDPSKDVAFSTYVYWAFNNHLKYIVRLHNSSNRSANFGSVSLDETSYDDEGCSVPRYEIQVEFEEPMSLLIDELDLGPRDRRILLFLLKGDNQSDIARRLNLSRARVNQIVKDISKRVGAGGI